MTEGMTLEIGTVPDREKEIVWIWVQDAHLAELSYENDWLRVELYGNPRDALWDLRFGEFVTILEKARRRMETALGVPTHCLPGTHTVRFALAAPQKHHPLEVEIWLERKQFAKLSYQSEILRIILSSPDNCDFWEFSFSELIELLNEARLFLAKAIGVPADQLT